MRAAAVALGAFLVLGRAGPGRADPVQPAPRIPFLSLSPMPGSAAATAATPAPAAPARPAPPSLQVPSTALADPAPPEATETTAITKQPTPAKSVRHPIASVAILGGLYATFSTWAYLAWYLKHKPLGYFKVGGDGWFGSTTYAGGVDKLGHAWSTMSLARAGTALLSHYGGYDRLKSSLVSTGLAETLFFLIEVKDGFFYEFSVSDFTGDSVGAALALLLDNFPRLDEMFDYRVEYFPSTAYWNNVSDGDGFSRLNIAEDYSGETYLLAYHLGSIHRLRDARFGTWSRFVDLTVGFDTRGYKPSPPTGYPPYDHHQELFLGVSLNAQGLFDWLLEGRRSGAARTTRKVTHGVFEIFNLPYTSHYLLHVKRVPTGKVMQGGA